MTNLVLDNACPQAQHFDLIPTPERLLCWGFELARLTEVHGDYYAPGMYKALLEGLQDLSNAVNKRLRERCFAVWGGDYSDSFWVGVPAALDSRVAKVLGQHFRGVAGYHTQEFGHAAALWLTVLFRYDNGQVIEYSDDSVAGQEYPDAYGSGVKVSYQLLW